MGYICTRCGGTNVACEAIVNPNTGKIIDYFDGSFMHAICSNCENEVIISNIEEVKHEIDLRFHEFVGQGFVHRKIRESYGRTLLQQVCP